MEAALHENAGAAEGDRLINAFADLVDGMHIRIWFSRPAIECAKCTDDVAYVGIIDVTVDDVRHNIVWILSLSYLIGSKPDADEIL